MKQFFEKLKNSKLLLPAVACVLLCVSLFLANGKNFDNNLQQTSDSQSYVQQLTNKMISVIQKIDGCGRVDVAISCANQGETQYAYETKSQTVGNTVTQTESIVLVNGKPLVVQTSSPKVSGVVVVAEGANDPIVRFQIVNVVVTLTNVSAENVRVFTYKD